MGRAWNWTQNGTSKCSPKKMRGPNTREPTMDQKCGPKRGDLFGPLFWSQHHLFLVPHHLFLVPAFGKCDRTFNFLWKRQFLPITRLLVPKPIKNFGPHSLGPTRKFFGPRYLPNFWSHTPRFFVHAFWSHRLGTKIVGPNTL